MSAPALRGAWSKVERAEKQIEAFDKEISDFFGADPPPYNFPLQRELYSVEWIPNPHTGRLDLRWIPEEKYRVIISVLRPLPLLQWGTMLGEIVHDLHCALDYLTWELTLCHQRRRGKTPPIPLRQPWTRVQFPISDTSRRWEDEVKRLWGIESSAHARFQRCQPYQWNRRYKTHPLWMLHELWNADKHRSVPVTVGVAVLGSIGLRPDGEDPASLAFVQNFSLEVLSIRSIRPLKDGAEIGKIVIHNNFPKGFQIPEPHPPMQVNVEVACQPRFKKAGPGKGKSVRQTLYVMLGAVRQVLTDFDREFH